MPQYEQPADFQFLLGSPVHEQQEVHEVGLAPGEALGLDWPVFTAQEMPLVVVGFWGRELLGIAKSRDSEFYDHYIFRQQPKTFVGALLARLVRTVWPAEVWPLDMLQHFSQHQPVDPIIVTPGNARAFILSAQAGHSMEIRVDVSGNVQCVNAEPISDTPSSLPVLCRVPTPGAQE